VNPDQDGAADPANETAGGNSSATKARISMPNGTPSRRNHRDSADSDLIDKRHARFAPTNGQMTTSPQLGEPTRCATSHAAFTAQPSPERTSNVGMFTSQDRHGLLEQFRMSASAISLRKGGARLAQLLNAIGDDDACYPGRESHGL